MGTEALPREYAARLAANVIGAGRPVARWPDQSSPVDNGAMQSWAESAGLGRAFPPERCRGLGKQAAVAAFNIDEAGVIALRRDTLACGTFVERLEVVVASIVRVGPARYAG